jgi:hypothetical protein
MTKDAALPVDNEEEEEDLSAFTSFKPTRHNQSYISSSDSGSGSGITSSDQYGSSGVDDSLDLDLDQDISHFDDLNNRNA